MNDNAKLYEAIGIFIGKIIVSPLIFWVAWQWAFVPWFGLPDISFGQAWLIAIIVSILTDG